MNVSSSAPASFLATPLGRRLRWLVVAVLAVGCLSVAAFDTATLTDDERAQALSERYACPTCDGQSVAESNAAVAATIRQFITVEVAKGTPDDEIRDQLIESYGTGVLLNPPSEGVSALIWILPIVVLVGGSAVVVNSLRRDADDRRFATDADRALVERALSGGSGEGGPDRDDVAGDDR